MRVVFPIVALLAYVHFVVALAIGFAAVAAVPVAAVALGAALLMGGQIALFVRLVGALLRITFGSLGCAVRLLQDLGLAVFERDEEPVKIPWSYGREALPEVFRLVDDVAAAMRTRGVDRVLVTHEASFGVFDLAGEGAFALRRRRHLVLGLPFVYALSLDEVRSIVAHELAHFTLGHTAFTRITWHFINRIGGRLGRLQEGDFWALNPVYWSTRLSLGLLASIYHPWSRLREHDADRRAARALGGNHFISALRKTRDTLPAVVLAQQLVVDFAKRHAVAPRHMGEAAARLSQELPAGVRRDLARKAQGDPLDLEGRTHPPTAVRIAALQEIPEKPPRHPEVAARYLPDLRNMEEHLTRAALRVERVEPARTLAARIVAQLTEPPPAEA